MSTLPGWFRLERLEWAFPLAVTLHNLEEAIWLPGWVAQHDVQLPWRVGTIEFRLTLVVLTFAAYLVTWLRVRFAGRRVWTYLFVAYTFIMFLNVWVPHVPASVVFGAYAPGVLTAVFVNLPVTGILLFAAIRERVVPCGTIAALVFGVPLAAAIIAAMVFSSAVP